MIEFFGLLARPVRTLPHLAWLAIELQIHSFELSLESDSDAIVVHLQDEDSFRRLKCYTRYA